MLKPYRYLETGHCKLHQYILAFFNRIKFETGDFSMDFFEPDFRPVANGHRIILKKRCENIYAIMKHWDQPTRSQFCQQIRDSNDIERICKREIIPLRISDIPESIRELIVALFKDLYAQVLDGDYLVPTDKGRMEHFKAFRKHNNNIIQCPICGISPLKTQFDKSRDPYDHYLPKSIYPLSSVNFHNLLPICPECNGLTVKGDCDILAVTPGRVYFPFDSSHDGITLGFSITRDDVDVSNMEWKVITDDVLGRTEEVTSWKTIYKIESRYLGYVLGRIEIWYGHYWEYLRRDKLKHLSIEDRHIAYLEVLDSRHGQSDFIEKPALETFLSESVLLRANIEARRYVKN